MFISPRVRAALFIIKIMKNVQNVVYIDQKLCFPEWREEKKCLQA